MGSHQATQQTIKVVHIASDDVWGGSEAQILQLLEPLEMYTPILVSFNKGELSNKAKDKGVEVFLAEENASIFHLLIKVLRHLKPKSADLLVSHGYKEAVVACVCSFFLSIPWVHVYHGVSEKYSGLKSLKQSLYLKLQNFLTHAFTKRIIFVSNNTKEKLGFSYSSKSSVIYNAAPLLQSSSIIKENDKIKLLWIGRLVNIKRPDIALHVVRECIEKNINISIDIAGSGPLQSKLQAMATSLEIDHAVHFHGYCEEVSNLLSKSTALLITSDMEGLPTVLLEAAHMNIPVISRAVGGIQEISDKLPKEALHLIYSEKPEDFIQAIETVASLDTSSLEYDTSYFLPQRMLDEHIAEYQRVIEQ